jgi:putative membrane protein
MVSDHQKAVTLFKQEASDNNDAELTAFARKTLPTIETHLQMTMQPEHVNDFETQGVKSLASEG